MGSNPIPASTMKTKYVVLIAGNDEVVYGHVQHTLKDARNVAEETTLSGYGKVKIFKLLELEEVSKKTVTRKL